MNFIAKVTHTNYIDTQVLQLTLQDIQLIYPKYSQNI